MTGFDNFLKLLPSVSAPKKANTITSKLAWTGIVLALYFIMGSIRLLGLDPVQTANLGMYQTILASDLGTLISLGIGPIVLASIILQLLAGVKIINFDFSIPEQRARFTGLQKLVAIVLSIIEAIVSVAVGFLAPAPGMFLIVVLQVALGSIILIYLDEIVSQYGIGSGIGLFIAAGVCQAVIWMIFSLPSSKLSYAGGLIFLAMNFLKTGATIELLSNVILPISATLIVFFIVVYAEGMHVNIPLTIGRSGMGANFPVKFLYVSNMPVILAATLFANVKLLSEFTKNTALGGFTAGLSTILTAPNNFIQTLIFGGFTSSLLLHAIIYTIIFVVTCVVFGVFWVEIGGQGTEAVAKQLQNSGMSIPGFRRDPRVIESVLKKYIPTITILGSIFVALLAVFADLTGALGTGTGILLTVGIVYRFYEQLAKEQVFQSSTLMKQLMGKQ
ncbi:MAG: preprotein translocase subunit SecY [archaeon]